MPQGFFEKIQIQLLLANFPLQLLDLPARLGKVIDLARDAPRSLHRQGLGLARPTSKTQRFDTAKR